MNVSVKPKTDWLAKADALSAKKEKESREPRKVRKKREWLLRKNDKATQLLHKGAKRYCGEWAYLPDLCLELIFQYLPFDVSFI